MVHSFALENSIEEIETADLASLTLAWELPYLGAPALLQIKCIEAEASYAMLQAARAHHSRHDRMQKDYTKQMPRKKLRESRVFEFDLIWRRSHTVEMISREIENARFPEEIREALDTDFRKYLHDQ